MSNSDLQKGYIYDNQIFPTLAAVEDYQRKPKVMAALKKLIDDTPSEEWCYENRTTIIESFKVNNSRHFLKTEKAHLEKALKAVVAFGDVEFEDATMTGMQKDMAFLLEHWEQSLNTFKWPTVKKLPEEDQIVAVHAALNAIEGSSEELSTWIYENIEDLTVALDTAKVKREVSSKATDGLNKYRLLKAQEKFGLKKKSLTAFEKGLLVEAGEDPADLEYIGTEDKEVKKAS